MILIDNFSQVAAQIETERGITKEDLLDAIEQALDSGDDVTGVTVHYVTEELDSGQVIKQQSVPILPDDTVETVTRAVQQCEHQLLPLVINSL